MSLPIFSASDDPGPSFAELLRRTGTPGQMPQGEHALQITHGTTVVAVRYADGVVMAGDRRATSGNLISHRTMEKVYPADQHSGVAIAGAAGPAMDMVKLFQLQLEHYEKVEGAELSLEGKANQLSGMVRSNLPAAMQGLVVVPLFAGFDLRRRQGRLFQLQLEHYEKVEGASLSLEGKANQLSMMVRGNLPAAMQGMVVVPIFAGFDDRRRQGRLFTYDVTGGRYEEKDLVATGSGSLHAGTVIKVGYRAGLSRDDAVDLAVKALWVAADADAATGGPDPLRGVYPTVATITATGFELVGDDELRQRFEAIAQEVRA